MPMQAQCMRMHIINENVLRTMSLHVELYSYNKTVRAVRAKEAAASKQRAS